MVVEIARQEHVRAEKSFSALFGSDRAFLFGSAREDVGFVRNRVGFLVCYMSTSFWAP